MLTRGQTQLLLADYEQLLRFRKEIAAGAHLMPVWNWSKFEKIFRVLDTNNFGLCRQIAQLHFTIESNYRKPWDIYNRAIDVFIDSHNAADAATRSWCWRNGLCQLWRRYIIKVLDLTYFLKTNI